MEEEKNGLGLEEIGGGGGGWGGGSIWKIIIAKGAIIFICNHLWGGGGVKFWYTTLFWKPSPSPPRDLRYETIGPLIMSRVWPVNNSFQTHFKVKRPSTFILETSSSSFTEFKTQKTSYRRYHMHADVHCCVTHGCQFVRNRNLCKNA